MLQITSSKLLPYLTEENGLNFTGLTAYNCTQIAKFMGLTWGPPGSSRPQMGPMLAPWTLQSD